MKVFYIDLLELVEFEFAEALLKFVEVNLKLMKIPVDLGDFVQLDIIKYFSFVFHFSSHQCWVDFFFLHHILITLSLITLIAGTILILALNLDIVIITLDITGVLLIVLHVPPAVLPSDLGQQFDWILGGLLRNQWSNQLFDYFILEYCGDELFQLLKFVKDYTEELFLFGIHLKEVVKLDLSGILVDPFLVVFDVLVELQEIKHIFRNLDIPTLFENLKVLEQPFLDNHNPLQGIYLLKTIDPLNDYLPQNRQIVLKTILIKSLFLPLQNYFTVLTRQDRYEIEFIESFFCFYVEEPDNRGMFWGGIVIGLLVKVDAVLVGIFGAVGRIIFLGRVSFVFSDILIIFVAISCLICFFYLFVLIFNFSFKF